MSEVEIYNQLNSDLKTVENLKWLPFVGDRYLKMPKEHQMLVVGESHYNDGKEGSKEKMENNIDWTRSMIQENAIEEIDWNTKIFPDFHKAMFSDNEFSKDGFWNKVCYYNFIQRSMSTISERPSYDEFSNNWNTFFDLVNILKPKTCVFIGVSSADYLMSVILDTDSDFSCEGVMKGEKINGAYSRTAILKGNDNNEIKLIFIKHTSQRFSWKCWNDFLEKQIGEQLNLFKEEFIYKNELQKVILKDLVIPFLKKIEKDFLFELIIDEKLVLNKETFYKQFYFTNEKLKKSNIKICFEWSNDEEGDYNEFIFGIRSDDWEYSDERICLDDLRTRFDILFGNSDKSTVWLCYKLFEGYENWEKLDVLQKIKYNFDIFEQDFEKKIKLMLEIVSKSN